MDNTVASWRRQQRQRLLAARHAVAPDERKAATEIIAGKLDRIVDVLESSVIGIYWPIRDEISLLHWGRVLAERSGVTLCLPVVVTPRAPLDYWRWTPGEMMQSGFWNIPVPARRDVLLPDLVLAPLVGFDRDNYRLGYGGGYFDRTLAARDPRPVVIGIGYDLGELATIFPQPHDIPMHAILTERRDTSPAAWSENAA